ncbi:MAG: isopeptide-forming domain-containing fimbrial protein [Oscillospiraceae bacterium]|jgi:fimbrial isopeptide formation D2 family protein/LPXTG-motif cell wall-anchored protein|nr:isopeptide-forming domain-containing fimbrial protein [Oscillospiraceae bacterium]
MKKTAKILALLLAVLVGMTTFVSLAFAFPPNFSFTIHKYLMKDLSKALNPNDGNILSPERQAELNALISGGDAVPKPGVTFRLYKLFLPTTAAADPRNGVVNPNADNAPWDNTAWVELVKAFNNISFILNDYDSPESIWLTDTLTYKGPVGGGGSGTTPYTLINKFDLLKAGATFDDALGTGSNGTGAVVYWEMTTDNNGVATIRGGSDNTDGARTQSSNAGATVPLTKGFYVVVEQIPKAPGPGDSQANDGLDIASISFPFIVALPMTETTGENAGKDWIRDIHAYPKNGDITITKDVDRTSVRLGEVVNWEIVVSVPADIKHYKQFFVTDTLDEALTYVAGSLKVTAMANKDGTGGATANHLITNPPSPATPYYRETVFAENDIKNADDIALNSQTLQPNTNTMLKVDFIELNTLVNPTTPQPNGTRQTYTVDGRSQLIGDFNNSLGDYTGPGHASVGGNGLQTEAPYNEFPVKFVKIEFQTYVNERILDRDPASEPATAAPTYDHESYTVYNEAFVRFKNRFDRDGDKPRYRRSNKTELHTSAIVFLKEDAHTNNILAGAGFQIASSQANAHAGLFLKRVLASVQINAPGMPAQYANVWTVIDVGATGFTYDANFDGVIQPGETARVPYTYAGVTSKWIEYSKAYNIDRPGYPGNAAPPITKPGVATGEPDSESFYKAAGWWAKVNGKTVVRFEGLKEYTGVFKPADADSLWMPKDTAPVTYMNSTGAAEPYQAFTGDGAYWVVEVFAPTVAGVSYNLLMDPIKLVFSATNSTKRGTLGWYTLDGGVVRNTNTFTLPRTGGVGTILFTAGGIALIGVAAVLLVLGAKKRKQKAANA